MDVKKKVLILGKKGRAVVVGPSNMTRTFLLIVLVFEGLRYSWGEGKFRQRPVFHEELTNYLRTQPQKLIALFELRQKYSVTIEMEESGNYLFYLGTGRYSGKPMNLINDLNSSLNNPDFLAMMENMLKDLRVEVDKKLIKGWAAKMTVAHADPSMMNRLQLDPADKRHKGAIDYFERMAGGCVEKKLEEALIWPPQVMKAS